ncbi:hypothetical protein ELI00_05300 [Rhizobium ruizarguesonis]|uniref:Rap1a/Tai family immunity protein n=1 Tax=Rhizobium ruizarguesonis TaxID=2081791 RepID=UPI0010316EC3|nr:Rap1a/Tai family immunity protein [Rhizobium ruizarguesonis]TAX75708.1 hypothetical protein ELI00_05300 [Rhizobium ruizarguesonis]
MRQLLMAAAAATIMAAQAYAYDTNIVTFQSGNEIYQVCQSAKDVERMLCLGYIEGVTDAYETYRATQGMQPCIRPGVTGGQLIDVTVRFYRNNPEKRDYAASSLIQGVREAFCPGK